MIYFLSALLIISLIALAWLSWRQFVLSRQLREYENTIRKQSNQDGQSLTLPANVKGLENLSNAVKELIGTLKVQLYNINATHARLAAVLDQMTDAVLIADTEGQIRFANPAAEMLFGPNLLNRTVAQTLRNHQLVQAWQRCQETEEVQIETVEITSKRHFLQLTVIPDQHAPGGSLLVVQDLTRIRKLETVRRDFISNLSHELRTPLASLKALTETLQDGALSDPKAAIRFLSLISTEVDALTQMAQELLDLSRIESGQIQLDREPVAPIALLTSAANRMKLQAERAGLVLSVDCPSTLPQVNVDARRIEQVLVNLIHNAVKFTLPGGHVILAADVAPRGEANGSAVQFVVRDSGEGIPSDEVPRIFERFYRVDKSRAGGGTGLGLSISRHLVEANGGKIWVESTEGKGSAFYFIIPTYK